MKSTLRSLCSLAILGMLAVPATAGAQLIPVKTTPIISGDSEMMLPSRTAGMGGLSIAVDDPLLDPFVNPARGSRLRGLRLFGVPTLYVIDDDQGGGRTVAGGFTFGSSRLFAGGFLSYQNLVNTLPVIPWLTDPGSVPAMPWYLWPSLDRPIPERYL